MKKLMGLMLVGVVFFSCSKGSADLSAPEGRSMKAPMMATEGSFDAVPATEAGDVAERKTVSSAVDFDAGAQGEFGGVGGSGNVGGSVGGSGSADGSTSGSAGGKGSVAGEVPKPLGERKLVYTADMTVEVKDLEKAEKAILAGVEKEGGYVASRSGDEYGIYFVLRLPSASLQRGIEEIALTGRTVSRSLSAEDVTDYFFDLEGRLRNKRILEERYRAYLREAKTVKDILDVEKRLSETTLEIERLEGSYRNLVKQIDYSTLSVNLRSEAVVIGQEPGFGKMLRELFASFGRTISVALVALLGVIMYGIPLVLFASLAWLLTFGRIGWLRKLFTLISNKKK